MSGIGFSPAMMQGLMNANTALKQAQTQSGSLNRLENRANLLKAEIESELGDVEGRKEELKEVEAQAKVASEMQMASLNQANESMANGGVTNDSTGAVAGKDSDKDKDVGEKKAVSKEAKAEASKLNEKFQDHNIVAVDHQNGMQYGKDGKTNVAISPEYLEKMGEDSSLRTKVEANLSSMREFDLQNLDTEKYVCQGWSVDKNGTINKWAVFTGDNTERLNLQAQLTEQGKSVFGDSFGKVSLFSPEEAAAMSKASSVAGLFVDHTM